MTMNFIGNIKMDATIVALGFFDGVHRGHAAIFAAAKHLADELQVPSVALTFDAHPSTIVAPDHVPALLSTVEEKEHLITQLGIDRVITAKFDRDLAGFPPEQFVKDILVETLGARGVVCGYDYRFGAKGRGNADLLRHLGKDLGFRVEQLAPVRYQDRVVSSTSIRQALQEGQVEDATELLGHYYALSGEVGHGMKRGRKMGFPTANIVPPVGKLVPRDGVYAVGVKFEGRVRLGLLSIGAKPTFFEGDRTIEVYIDGENLDLYGRELTLIFLSRLRGIVKYETMDELRSQISLDLANARQLWSVYACNLDAGVL